MSWDKHRPRLTPDMTPPSRPADQPADDAPDPETELALAACEEAMREHGILQDARALILAKARQRLEETRKTP